MIYGYARVSTDGQTVGALVEALTAAGAAKVFSKTAGGVKADRARFRKVLAALDDGDGLMMTRLARLVRSTRDLLNTLAAITHRKAGFCARVVARGVEMGPKPKLTPHQRQEILCHREKKRRGRTGGCSQLQCP
jgi:hypothetical protein